MTAEVRSIRTPFSAPPASTAGATDLTLTCPHLDLFFTTFLPKWPGPGATELEYSRFLEQFIAAKHVIVDIGRASRGASGWKHMEIWVVDVTEKKKTKNK